MQLSFFKKITLCIGILSLGLTPILSLANEQKPNELQLLYTAHTQVLESSLLGIMHELETSIAYWQSLEDSSFSHAIIRGPKGWLSSNTAAEDIQEHINVLSDKQTQVATALGTLISFQNAHVPLSDKADLIASINNCFAVPDALLGKTALPSEQFDSTTIISYATESLKQIPHFQEEYLAQISDHLKPNHFVRNWTKYALAAGCFIAATAFAYKNQDKFETWQQNGKEAVINFWKNHIVKPLENTKEILFGRKHLQVITPEAVAGSERTFTNNLDRLLPIIRPNASKEELATLKAHILTTKDSSLIVEFWDDQAKHLIWNATTNFYNGNLHFLETNASLIQLKDWQFSQFALAIKQLWEAQQLNAEIIAIFPVVIGLYGIKKGYDAVFHRKIVSEPLQQRLTHIDKLLNKYNTGDFQLDTAGTGFLHYHLAALQQYVGRIPSNKQKTFTADLQELKSPTYNVTQKLRVIDQMHRQYAFLNPLTI